MSDTLLPQESLLQVGALCWRPALEVLLITSLHSRRWIIPKGWPMPGLTSAQAAAREALEEAGVTGEIGETAIGAYHYLKARKDGSVQPCRVEVFALKVSGQQPDWLEKGAREQIWMSPEQAAVRVDEPGLRHLLLDFRKRPQPERRSA